MRFVKCQGFLGQEETKCSAYIVEFVFVHVEGFCLFFQWYEVEDVIIFYIGLDHMSEISGFQLKASRCH